MSVITFPDEQTIQDTIGVTPEIMRRNYQPFAVMASEYLTRSQCDEIVSLFNDEEPYVHDHCGAVTRQLLPPMRGALRVVEDFALGMNKLYWQYDLDPDAISWLQTYKTGGDYQSHADTYVGQSRKLTAVVILSKPEDYVGGELLINAWPSTLNPPPAQGSIVIFQPWLMHQVTPVTEGVRQTINMGFWGPQFK